MLLPLQIGNAVAPPLAAGLGRCLLLAATEDAPVGVAVVDVPDPEYEAVAQECRAKGIGFWCEKHTVDMVSTGCGSASEFAFGSCGRLLFLQRTVCSCHFSS